MWIEHEPGEAPRVPGTEGPEKVKKGGKISAASKAGAGAGAGVKKTKTKKMKEGSMKKTAAKTPV